MNLDKRIKDELESEAQSIDRIMKDREGLWEMLMGPFKSGMSTWFWLANIIVLLVTVLLFWCGYQFFTSSGQQDQVYWGICTLLAVGVQIALKQWLWMEMNRNSLLREIKRLEIAVIRLDTKMSAGE